jgi:adenosylcobalamin-dependent ribonucleoside-triphosphate reductase
MNEFLSFHLSDNFIDEYKDVKPSWGFPIGGGNTLGEITFLTKYSRLKDDGSKEKWYEVCRRVVEGYYSILKDHCTHNRTPWIEIKAQAAAKDAYDRMFNFKWLPPGRGLWAMGSALVNEDKNSGPLFNCSFVSTGHISPRSTVEATRPFQLMAEMSMNGIGVGFDTLGAGRIDLQEPLEDTWTFEVPDSREGWAEAFVHILESFFFKNRKTVIFDYSLVRPAGAPIKRFGGTASGPEPLKFSLEKVRELLSGRGGESLASRDITDIMNLIGKAVVAGNTRRSAQIALGNRDDKDFISIKNWELEENMERMRYDGTGWGGLSNNTVVLHEGDSPNGIVDSIRVNGEPGIFNIDIARNYGRLVDGPDYKDGKVQGLNPCGEATLEHAEFCNLSIVTPMKHEDLDDFQQSIKHAYLYCKAVTLLPTPWPETNEVITRNRRIGVSLAGVAQFVELYSWSQLRDWANSGYEEIERRDVQFSEWLGIRESIKKTVEKPDGTTPILFGATSGIHWPVASTRYIRTQRFAEIDPIVDVFREAGYKIEPSVSDKGTVVVYFYVKGNELRSERQVSIWEKASLAVLMQRYWADQSVSVTLSFRPDEEEEVDRVIDAYADQLKSLSFLPLGDEVDPYPQMPFQTIEEEEFEEKFNKVKALDFEKLYDGSLGDVEADKFCTTDTCTI